MDIIEMDDIRPEIIKQFDELGADFTQAKTACSRTEHRLRSIETYLRGEIIIVCRLDVLGMTHCEDSCLIAVFTKKLFQINGIYTITPATVPEFICDKDFH